ncbi:uncharacterized protein LOC117191721 [Drosophila miranda]|uniref:uncharacterized protein LOC117191721 n=1 Tax=Drosophila miranda TaxID=7229 RepID=UPI00143F6A32|nr:uncharacterized protein LOC117191721 [Drosophila miranda]
MNATENTPAKAHQRAAASAESPEVVDLTDFSDAEGSRDIPPLFSRRPSGFRRENLWSPPPYKRRAATCSPEPGSPSFEEEFEDAGSSQHSFPEPETPSYAPMFEQEFEDAGYHQRRHPRTGRGIYRPERGLERYTPKPYNAYYDDGESEEEEPYGRQFIAETETFHHTLTPWGLRVTRKHQMSVDVFVPPGRNVNAFFRTFRKAAEPIDYRSEPAAPARASPPHAEARPPTPASDPPRCPNPPEESAATTPTHAEAPHAEAAQGPPTEWPTGATEEGNAAPVRQAELTEPEEQWETGPDSGYPTMTLRRVKQPVAEETAPTPKLGNESTREGQSPADFSLIEELNQPTQWVIAPADWQVNILRRALPAGLIEEIHQRLLETERLRFRSWSWDQCYRVHKRSRAAATARRRRPSQGPDTFETSETSSDSSMDSEDGFTTDSEDEEEPQTRRHDPPPQYSRQCPPGSVTLRGGPSELPSYQQSQR